MFKTNKSKWIATTLAFGLIAVVLIAFGLKLNRQEKTTTYGFTSFAIGALNPTNGKIVESKKALYTKDLGHVDGLEITLKDDATITYYVAFYDEDKVFIEATDAQTDDFDTADVSEGAEYFRVLVVPNQIDEEDVVLNALNMIKYANMITITCNK